MSDYVAPYLFAHLHTPVSSSHRQSSAARKDRSAARRMEASYDVIGSDAHSEATLDSASDRSIEDDGAAAADVNGEEVRGEVEAFLKKQVVSAATAGLGFLMAVVGIWGDGAVGYVSETVVNVIEI